MEEREIFLIEEFQILHIERMMGIEISPSNNCCRHDPVMHVKFMEQHRQAASKDLPQIYEVCLKVSNHVI